MKRDTFFRQIKDGTLPSPKAAQTLDASIASVDFDTDPIKVKLAGKEALINHSKIQRKMLP